MDASAEAAVRRARRPSNSSGLWRTDVYKQDRQNFMACVRRAGYKVRRALIDLQPPGALNMQGPSVRQINRIFLPASNAAGSDPLTTPVLDAVFHGADDLPWGSRDTEKPQDIKTQGTVAFYVLCAAYMLIHHSRHFGILQRIRFCGYVNMFAAHWRCWVIRTPGLTLGNNFLTKECYSDLVQSCHEAAFQAIVFRRFAPSLPLRFHYSDSNVCENSFSSAGGYRGMHGNRNYTALGYVDYVDKEYVMHVLHAAGVRRGRNQHHKQEWDSRYHEPRTSREELDRRLRQHPSPSEMTASWNAGADDATHFAEKLGLRNGVDYASWLDPWTGTSEKLHVEEAVQVHACHAGEDGDDSDDAGDDELDGYTPPGDSTCGVTDVRVASTQALAKKLGDRAVLDVTIQKIGVFLFTQDSTVAAEDILQVVALARETSQQRKDRMKQQHQNRMVTMPGSDVQISKEQLVAMMVQEVLRNGRFDGTTLSKDRVARIKATAARVKAEAEGRYEPAVEGDRASLQDDLAFCFIHSDGSKKLWLGKLQQMRSKAGRRTRNLHNSVDLCNPPEDLRMQCQWYHETRKGSHRYVPSARTVNVDKKFVHVSSCLGLVELDYNSGVYTMADNGKLDRFKRLMDTIN